QGDVALQGLVARLEHDAHASAAEALGHHVLAHPGAGADRRRLGRRLGLTVGVPARRADTVDEGPAALRTDGRGGHRSVVKRSAGFRYAQLASELGDLLVDSRGIFERVGDLSLEQLFESLAQAEAGDSYRSLFHAQAPGDLGGARLEA